MGYPPRLYQLIRHPVVWIGQLLLFFERRLNSPHYDSARIKKLAGIFIMLIIIVISGTVAILIEDMLGAPAVVIAMASLFATRSLYQHVSSVKDGLQESLAKGREAVAKIVGRDVERLDAHGVSRAAIESLAESFCDGVVAPFFYAVIFGLPGLAIYKTINTADSMIGHKDERYMDFGWAAAKIDDLANYIPARLAALLLVVASQNRKNSWWIVRQDAHRHDSPNAGWPEAAMAGGLGLALAGDVSYEGQVHIKPFIGDGRRDADEKDIGRALALYKRANIMLVVCALILAVLV